MKTVPVGRSLIRFPKPVRVLSFMVVHVLGLDIWKSCLGVFIKGLVVVLVDIFWDFRYIEGGREGE